MHKEGQILLFGIAALLILGRVVEAETSIQAPNASSGSLSHGEEQLSRFLNDRSQLQTLVKKGNPLWTWLEAAFENQAGGIAITWEDKPTSDFNSFGAESRFPPWAKIVYIRVDRYHREEKPIKEEVPAEELLSNLVFELNNAKKSMTMRLPSQNRNIQRMWLWGHSTGRSGYPSVVPKC